MSFLVKSSLIYVPVVALKQSHEQQLIASMSAVHIKLNNHTKLYHIKLLHIRNEQDVF